MYEIIPYDINAGNKTASFKICGYDAYVTDYDLTSLSYTTEGGQDLLVVTPAIFDSGADLAAAQALITQTAFPRVNGNKRAKELIAAKDAV